jgi:hypothetical protein
MGLRIASRRKKKIRELGEPAAIFAGDLVLSQRLRRVGSA